MKILENQVQELPKELLEGLEACACGCAGGAGAGSGTGEEGGEVMA